MEIKFKLMVGQQETLILDFASEQSRIFIELKEWNGTDGTLEVESSSRPKTDSSGNTHIYKSL